MPTRSFDAFRFAAAVVLSLSLLACGSSADKARAERAKRLAQTKAIASAAAPTTNADADMVNAATPGGPGPPIGLKFRLAGRPVVGEPLVVDVVMTPDTLDPIRHLYGSFTAGDGLLLQSDHSVELRNLAEGVPLRQEVTVVPQQAGILSLTATLILDFDNGSVSRTFGIPLIATVPVAASPPMAPGPAVDSPASTPR